MESMDQRTILEVLKAISSMLRENEKLLTDLDAAIGDADHGINMVRGFEAVEALMPSWKEKDIGAILKSVGMALVSSVGGASGPLYGTAFMEAGKVAAGKVEIGLQDLIPMLDRALEGIRKRGHAEAGEKTMIDAIQPAIEAMRQTSSLPEAVQAARMASLEGMKKTIDLVARKGRASYLGERSRGHQDPGATSSALMFEALARVLEEK
jgi:dihydroxyacetone kinase-like protein